MSFDFLKNLKLREPDAVKAKPVKAELSGLSLRITKNGNVYPSVALVQALNLEYGLPNECGLDFFVSSDWALYPKDYPKVLFIAAVPRSEAKIDLFSFRRTDNVSVITQGPSSPELLRAVKENFNNEDWEHLDLFVHIETPFTTENGIYYLPKKISKGDRRGELTTVRRENITLYPLSLEPASVTSVAQSSEQDIVQEPA